MSNFEQQYLDVMRNILSNGVNVPTRTGIDALTTWGQTIRADLSEGFPIVTTRKTSLKIAFEETWFFLRGETDTKKLEEKKINIWKGNTTREFLDNVGLDYLPEGHMGKGYSFQWRNFGGDYKDTTKYHSDYRGTYPVIDTDYSENDDTGVDQLVNLLNGLKTDPHGRRHIITGWNPAQLKEMALPPCHLYQQYHVMKGRLNSSFVMRSWDFLYGSSFNIMGYALLNHVFAKFLNLEPGELFAVGMDVHLYANQMDIARQQIDRTPYPLPKLVIHKDINTIDDILSLEYSDISLEGYKAHPDFKNKPPMAT
ncbi:thymidylate synthase [Xanthomonas phage Xoo-sp13]|nr:thymidylate synthase [Xanthomonas phage Xoo-sp13]